VEHAHTEPEEVNGKSFNPSSLRGKSISKEPSSFIVVKRLQVIA
jgi:hypothetical protein